MKLPLFTAFTVMLPRLMARESLRRVSETGVGTGSLKPGRSKDIVREWGREAEAKRRARKATESDLAALPIRVRHVSKES